MKGMFEAQWQAWAAGAAVALIWAAGAAWAARAAGTTPADAVAPGPDKPKVVWLREIWDGARHNAFPDLARFKGKWYVGVREGALHGIAGAGKVRVISSADGKRWRPVALFEGNGDYRRPRVSVGPDGRLAVVAKFNPYLDTVEQVLKDPRGKVRVGEAYTAVAFTRDGREWTGMKRIALRRAWFYSGIRWHAGTGYATDRRQDSRSTLYATTDGVSFKPVTKAIRCGNESSLSFLPEGEMIAFFRNGSIGRSRPPYTRWEIDETNEAGPHSHGGPNVIALPDGQVWTACRGAIGRRQGTLLCRLEGKTLKPMLLLPGGGDRGYNGLVWHEGHLWMAFNSPTVGSKRGRGRSSIWLAKLKLPPAPASRPAARPGKDKPVKK